MTTDKKTEILEVSWDIEGCGRMNATITNNKLTSASFCPVGTDLANGLETDNWEFLKGIHKAVGEIIAHIEQATAPKVMPEPILPVLPEPEPAPYEFYAEAVGPEHNI